MHQKQGVVMKKIAHCRAFITKLKNFMRHFFVKKKKTLKHRNFTEIRQVKDVVTENLIPLDIIIQRNNLYF